MRAVLLSCAFLAACASAPDRRVESESAKEVTQAPPASPMAAGTPVAQLEAIFWACDYVATTRGMDATPVAQCAAATRELRRVKFANSFHALLAWWRENKESEHGRMRRERNEL